MNLDLKNLSEEDKRKYVVYGIFGIVSVIVIGLAISFTGLKKDENKEVNNLDVPLSEEQRQYENRLEALKKFDTVKPDTNQRMTQFFAREKKNDVQDNIEYFEQNKNGATNSSFASNGYEPINQNIDSKSPVRNNNNTSYNKYGNDNMWQVEEPQNSNIGYSAPSRNQEYIQKRTQQIETRMNDDDFNSNISNQKVENKISKKELFENGKQTGNSTIKAVIRGTQEIKNGQTIRFQTSEEGIVNGVKIPRNTSLYGTVRFNQYRADITIETANIGGSIVPINLLVYSNDGIKGIPISVDEAVKQGKNTAVDEVARTGGVLGKAGSIVGGVISNKNKEQTVKFIDNQKILLLPKL